MAIPGLNRGIAVLAIEGPGQYEARLLGSKANMPAWTATGPAIFDWLMARPEIDSSRIAITGRSFGSFFATIAVANEPRFKACAVSAVCFEPGFHTIFEEASPTFKRRFMWMAGYQDEAAFDAFCKTMTWQGHAENIRIPYLAITGEADELSPLAHTETMLDSIQGPKMLVIYQDARHALNGVPALNLGPAPATLLSEWIAARLAGKSFASERWFVDAGGGIEKTPL